MGRWRSTWSRNTRRHPTAASSFIAEHQEVRRRLELLREEAAACGERLEKFGHALLTHPERLIIGVAPGDIDPRLDWITLTDEPLPSIEHLADLAARIRVHQAALADLQERLILAGRSDLVESPDEFFH